VKCTTSAFASTTTLNGAKQVTVNATYTGKLNATPHGVPCQTNLGTDSTINMNGCAYLLTGLTDAKHNGVNNTHAQVHIVCPAGAHIKVTTGGVCDLLIPTQTPTEGGIKFTNQAGPPKDVLLDITVTGITYTSTGGFCGFFGVSAEGNNATYTGTVTVKGFKDTNGLEGTQIGLEQS
jgi:hypothetical protein